MTFVKICGLTNPEDAHMALEAGADMLGFVNAVNSPRYLTPEEISGIINEVMPAVPTVLVTHSEDITHILNTYEAAATDIVQLHAPLTLNEYLEIKSQVPTVIANVSIDSGLKKATDALKSRVEKVSELVDYLLLDTKFGTEIGGTGKTYDWNVAKELMKHSHRPVIIAGGLNPENVSSAVEALRPFAVDVSSGVEGSVGKKDPEKVTRFIKQARSLL